MGDSSGVIRLIKVCSSAEFGPPAGAFSVVARQSS